MLGHNIVSDGPTIENYAGNVKLALKYKLITLEAVKSDVASSVPLRNSWLFSWTVGRNHRAGSEIHAS